MKCTLLCTTAVVLCLSLPASAQQAITTPIFTAANSDQNFRDLAGIAASMGGSGFVNPVSHNGVMRTGVFYRSEALSTGSLSPADRATIESLHIGLDIDLRTPGEIYGTASIMAPNAGTDQPIGAAYVNINIYGKPNTPSSAYVNSPTLAAGYMITTYQNFVTDPVQLTNLRSVLLTLADASGAVLYHCSGGKDRTGWTSMLLQTIAGVPLQIILQDYRATNNYMAGSIAYALSTIDAVAGDAVAKTAAPMLGVDDSYLQAGLTQVAASYGSVDAYLKQGLGLTQADIYVLRAKMVYYVVLPGQSGFSGNAAAGADFLNAMQNSPLSGHYTSFNDYLQSAVDAGTLGGVEAQAGGQIHADAASHALRQPQWLDRAVAPYASGRTLSPGQTQLWFSGGGGYLWSDAHDGIAASAERNAGTVIGATHRIDAHASMHAALAYDWGHIASAGGSADSGSALVTIGGRYGFDSLDAGFFVAASADAGRIDYRSKRALGGGLGMASGHGGGWIYGASASIGDVIQLSSLTLTPQVGLRFAKAAMNRFAETGSELALSADNGSHASSVATAALELALDPTVWSGWTLQPSLALGFEHTLDNGRVKTTASLYSISVSQDAAFDDRYLAKAGIGMTAARGAWSVCAGFEAVHGDSSTGVQAQLTAGYRL